MDPRLTDSILQALNSGWTPFQIREELLRKGWLEKEVEEALHQATKYSFNESKKHNFRWLWIILPILIIFILGALAIFYFSQDSRDSSTTNQNSQILQGTSQTSIIECGTDMSCFISSAESCQKARVRHTANLDWGPFGFEQTVIYSYEIKDVDDRQCNLYLRLESNSIRFKEEFIQQMLNTGASEEEIRQQEQESNNLAKQLEGKDGICIFNDNQDMVNLLISWNEGNFSTGDFENNNAVCSGFYFEEGILEFEN